MTSETKKGSGKWWWNSCNTRTANIASAASQSHGAEKSWCFLVKGDRIDRNPTKEGRNESASLKSWTREHLVRSVENKRK